MGAHYTDEQLASIRHLGGHSITHACAGSGKTSMLVGRIRYLLEQGILPERIRVLAFNVAAVEEFRTRLAGGLPTGAAAPKVQTFNAIGQQLVARFEGEGWLPRLRLETNRFAETRLARWAAATALAESGRDATPGQDEIDALCQFIGLVKSDVVSAREAFETFRQPAHLRYFVRAFDLFEEARLRAGVRFFADQVAEPVAVIRANSSALAMVSDRLDYVIVDEFQDTSRVQLELLSQILGTRGILCCVGDGDQSIYGFRGSAPRYMSEEFDHFFPGATRFALTRTFRFGHQVSLAANLLIRHNPERSHDTLCVSAPGTPQTVIRVIRATMTGPQSDVLEAIKDWRRRGRALRECAVLARQWGHMLSLELSLLAADVPYYKPGGDVFAVPEISGLLGYLRLASGTLFEEPNVREIVRNMLSTPTLWLTAQVLDRTTEAILKAPDKAPAILGELVGPKTKPAAEQRLMSRAHAWRHAAQIDPSATTTAAEALQLYAQSTEMLATFISSGTTEGAHEKAMAYAVLLDWAISTGEGIADFLARMDRLRDTRKRYEAGGDAVLLSTIHRSKGLEYPFVMVLGLEQGQFPSPRSNVAEERRLAYVAITRAKEEVHLVVPHDEAFDAALRGPASAPALLARARSEASCFALEMDLHTSVTVGSAMRGLIEGGGTDAALPCVRDEAAVLVNRYFEEVGVGARVPVPQEAGAQADADAVTIGDRVRHPAFGEGMVVGMIDVDILDIDFGGQRRALRLGVAPLERQARAGLAAA
ncbi:MAG: ATP-dependent helicase [Sphingobacteriia bacterium]|nr:ATP-dependent helicase [Sphingobacteriia bacterium]